jgi:DNA polymerase-3 subunit beta
MQIQVQTDILRDALNKILTVVDKKNSRPILTCTFVNAKDSQIELSATDLEVSAKVVIPGKVNQPGQFCVNTKNIFDILRELPEGEVILEMGDNETSLKLHYKDIFYSLLIYKSDDFPHLSFENQNNQFELNSAQLQKIIQKTSHAISSDETRLFLNGIYLQEIDHKLRAVATDGHRLALIETELEQGDIETLINGIIVPKKGVYELKKLAEAHPEMPIKISLDESFMFASTQDKYFLSIRLIAREYPKYQASIPGKMSYTMHADRNVLMDAVKRIRIMSNEKSHGVRLKFTEKEVSVMAQHPSLGEAQETLSVDYDGKEMEVGFNARFLIDALNSLDEGDVTIELNNELSPVLLKSSDLPNYLGIIMPLRL